MIKLSTKVNTIISRHLIPMIYFTVIACRPSTNTATLSMLLCHSKRPSFPKVLEPNHWYNRAVPHSQHPISTTSSQPPRAAPSPSFHGADGHLIWMIDAPACPRPSPPALHNLHGNHVFCSFYRYRLPFSWTRLLSFCLKCTHLGSNYNIQNRGYYYSNIYYIICC